MASDLLKEFSGADELQQSLGQIRGGRQDCEMFFDDALKRLELTLNEAVREQQAWEEQRAQTQSELDGQAAEVERRRQELQSQHEQFFNETLVATQEQFQQRFDKLAAASNAAQQQFQQQIQQHFEELLGQNSQSDHAAVEQQKQLNEELRQQRQVLELVLKRLVELESLATATARANEFAAQAGRAEADGDSVLSSVLSQFEVLQKDVARRRNEAAG